MFVRLLIPVCAIALWACGSGEPEAAAPAREWLAEGPMVPVTLPGGDVIQAELRQTPEELQSGMMFRPELPPDHGMLFIFNTLEPRAFWMYRTLHPLDIVWMDGEKRIVEIEENVPPCPSLDARECPTVGGVTSSLYTLELAAGQVIRRGLKIGDQLQF